MHNFYTSSRLLVLPCIILYLQRGQVAFMRSHLSIQALWKWCLQGISRNSTPSSYGNRQMQHSCISHNPEVVYTISVWKMWEHTKSASTIYISSIIRSHIVTKQNVMATFLLLTASSPEMARSVRLSEDPTKLITPASAPLFSPLTFWWLLSVCRNLNFASALMSSSDAPSW